MSLYDVLGIDSDASPKEVKDAYRRMAQKCHPDKGSGDSEMFVRVKHAFDILSDPEKRAMYDRSGVWGTMSPSTYERATAEVLSLFTQMLSVQELPVHLNLVSEMLKIVAAEVSKKTFELAKFRRDRKRFSTVKRNLRSKDGNNMLLGVLRRKRIETWAGYRATQENLRMLHIMESLIQGYEYDAPQQLYSTVSRGTTSTASFTTLRVV